MWVLRDSGFGKEWGFTARGGSLVNYGMSTCLLLLISLFAQYIFFKRATQEPLNKDHSNTSAAADSWSLTLICTKVCVQMCQTHLLSPLFSLEWTERNPPPKFQADNETYFLSKAAGYFLSPLCVCLCLHVTLRLCASLSCVIIWWADFCRLACYLNGFEGIAFGVQRRLWHQRNSPKPSVSSFTQPHREQRGREAAGKCFLYSRGRRGIQGTGSYLGYCLS